MKQPLGFIRLKIICLMESWGQFFSCWKLPAVWWWAGRTLCVILELYLLWPNHKRAEASLSRPSYTRSFHIIQSALFNSNLLFFFQIWRPQRRTGYRLWKGEILDVIKQITGSRYSWIGSYHIAFGDSEVQSCVTFLLQLILSLRTEQLVLKWGKVVIVVVIVVILI